ncbi:MAG: hypothetical protein ACYC6Q_03260 [Syntrophales bacterium]
MAELADSKDKVGYIDQKLQHILKTGDIPFLGLYSKLLPLKIREVIKINLAKSSDPLSQFMVYLYHWPAISLIYLTIHVSEGFGSHGTFEVYPFLQDALQLTSPLTTSQRDKLWKTYRASCFKLGLSISTRLSGAHFMVGEYLKQGGVPIPYVEDLTDKMIRYGKIANIPDDDDPVAIKRWQDGLIFRLLPPFSKVARQAIVLDDNGYYIRLFLKLLEKPAEPATALSDFELRMSDAIHKQEITAVLRKKGNSLRIAQVIWRDNQLGVELPPGERTEWVITIGDVTTTYIGQMESRFISFDKPLPPFVEIHGEDRSSPPVNLWEDEKNNRLLIFTASGTFVSSSKLSEEPITLEPGDYHIVSRFIPDDLNETVEEVRRQPSLYLLPIRLDPGGKFVLKHGPATLELHADLKPILLWEGMSIKGLRGNEIYCSNNLKLHAIIPEEYFVDGAKYYVRFSQTAQTEELIAKISNDQPDAAIIDVYKLIRHRWKPGVTRILAEIYREGIQRPVFRSSIMLWIGLDSVRNRTHFYFSACPSNLIEEECDNLYVNREDLCISYRNKENRFFRMVFNLGDVKRFIFTLTVPGIFMQLKDYSASTEIERPLKKGATLSIAWNSRKVLEISSTSRGFLILGNFRTRMDFSKRLPLTGLVEYLGPEVHTLQFIDDDSSCEEDLLHLVAPHEIIAYCVAHKSNLYRIHFSMSQKATEIIIKATDLLSGRCGTLLLGCNSAIESTDSGMRGWLTCENDDQQGIYNHDFLLSLDGWPNGAWIIDLEANMNGRWGKFSNAGGDKFSAGFIMVDGTISNNAIAIEEDYKGIGADAQMEIFQRVNERMHSCYALESWKDLNWIENIWHGLLDELRGQAEYASELLSFSEQSPPEETSCSWVPMRTLSAYCPELYALPARYFSKISNTTSLLIKCLSTMSHMKYGLLPLFHDAVLHQIFAFGYLNVQKISQGEEPFQFNMKRYKGALKMNDLTDRLRLLKQDDWLPGDGDYLGALHYLYALGKLEERFKEAMSGSEPQSALLLHCDSLGKLEDRYRDTMTGNEQRRGKALYLCRSMLNYHIHGLPSHLASGLTYIGFLDAENEDNLTIEQEFILQICKYLSIFARICRWEARNSGCLEHFITQAKNIVGESKQFESIFGYPLYIGKEIFGFYLMLWEAVLRTDYNTGEKNVYVRKQSSGSL